MFETAYGGARFSPETVYGTPVRGHSFRAEPTSRDAGSGLNRRLMAKKKMPQKGKKTFGYGPECMPNKIFIQKTCIGALSS